MSDEWGSFEPGDEEWLREMEAEAEQENEEWLEQEGDITGGDGVWVFNITLDSGEVIPMVVSADEVWDWYEMLEAEGIEFEYEYMGE